MNFSPTEEQIAAVAAAKDTDDNLIIQALAGAAKTSTLILIAEALSTTSILALAFNKKIAVEMQQRLPPNCQAMTLNALGHRTWMEATGRRFKVETSKTYDIMKELVEDLGPEDKKEAYDRFSELIRLVGFGKACGYIPSGHYDRARRLMDDESFFAHIEQQLTDVERDLVTKATLISLDQSFKGLIDFDDQVLMPTIFQGAFPRYPLVLIDEAQDLSALNHATLHKLAKRRLIAVGDSRQAIYGFRGAHEDSMSVLQQSFSMKELNLSISFRCPEAIVEHARWRAPHMKAFRSGGSVNKLDLWSAHDLPEVAAIICRNNAPLFSIAIKLLKAGRSCEIGNSDIAKVLAKTMSKLGKPNMLKAELISAIDRWEEKEKNKNKKRAHGGIADRAACMRVFAEQGDNLGEAIAYANHLASQVGSLKLLTGHKSKGLEFDDVFFLDEELVGPEDQDPNLRYVIITRAKNSLTYIRSADYVE